ncbi:unnamed protein product [Paramecium octaurelia]|uniref:Uncharacterized protein n=1 Tax=Paramecium octaurelia TaxID=43137 RepID=A0A8S1VRI8_PAROT|nr:unnamed protein product [Paramecium octaurelia]
MGNCFNYEETHNSSVKQQRTFKAGLVTICKVHLEGRFRLMKCLSY